MIDVKAYVGVTDWDWYRFLHQRGATEVNFWQPSGRARFGAIPQAAPFLFKTHYSHGNRIVGGGFLSGWARLPLSSAGSYLEVFGAPRLAPVRVGQAAFKALVQEAYGRRCAITGDKIVPVLQAAHIRPVTESGENRVDNGLLLRSDVHTLFDRGYLAVHPERKTLIVSPRLRGDWGNGEEFYQRARSAEPIRLPERKADRPNANFLTWHADQVFMNG